VPFFSYSGGIFGSYDLSRWIGGSKGQGLNDFTSSETNEN